MLLINIDSKLPNLALEKIAMWHRDDEVIWDLPIMASQCDKVYVSCIYTKNKYLCNQWKGMADIGGSGYDLQKRLPEEIEALKPRINWGFTTRGCIRKCGFCFVPEKEGKIRIMGDLLDLWDGKSREVIVLDNNILALPKHFKKICKQANQNKIKLDFNQGLDIRLLTNDLAQELNSIEHTSDIRFAWDSVKDEKYILDGIETLKRNNCKRAMFYVIVGFNTTIEEDLHRFNILKRLGQRAYCMRHENTRGVSIYNDLSAWVNQQRFLISMSFERFQECRKDRSLIRNTKRD